MIRPLALALAATLGACTSWQRNDARLAQPLAPRDRVQIWVATTAHEVHGVVFRGDSLTAVPSGNATTCDSCRVTFARADIDSVRTVDGTGGTLVIAGGAVIVLLILYLKGGLASNYP